jgi:hypothetical protein
MKRLAPLVLLICFVLSCGSGALLGSLVKSPAYPREAAVPLYPGARDVVDRATKIAGLASPTPFGDLATPPALIDFVYVTDAAPDELLAFYTKELQAQYGFQVWRVESSAPGVTVARFVRDTQIRYIGPFPGPNGALITYAGWDKELVTLTMTTEDGGVTRVDGKLEPRPYQP